MKRNSGLMLADFIALLKKYPPDSRVLLSKDTVGRERIIDVEDYVTPAWLDEDGDVVMDEYVKPDESTRDMCRAIVIWPTR